MATQEKNCIIIDGNAIVHRAYHALPPMTTKDGTAVNAVYGFASMLLKVIHDLAPAYIAVTFDVGGKTFRDSLYEKYKAKRVKADQDLYDQIPLIYQIVEAFDIPIYTKEGFEADDVIGTIAKKVKKKKENIKSIIVTGDQDFLQLVDDDITEVYLLKKGLSDFELYNEQKVVERFGFGPERIVDYKSLKGDTSDNIPGVPGIGEKTAKELIESIGGIDDIYEDLQKKISKTRERFRPSVVQKLEAGEKDARLSRELATIHDHIPDIAFDLAASQAEHFDYEKIKRAFHRFEFFSLTKRIPGAAPQPEEKPAKKKKVEGGKTIHVVTPDTVDDFFSDLARAPHTACKEMTVGGDALVSDIRGFIFVIPQKTFFLDVASFRASKSDAALLTRLGAEVFARSELHLIGHDIKKLLKVLLTRGIAVKARLFDVMIASYVINSSTRAHDVTSILLREFSSDAADSLDDVSEKKKSQQTALFGEDPAEAAQEAEMILQVYAKYDKKLEDMDNLGLFEKIEMALIPVLARMELYGVAIDTAMLKQLSSDFDSEVQQLTKAIWKEAGQEFNIASSVQLRDMLFITMGLPTDGIKKGKTGYSTAAPELEKLREASPIIPLIEQYREVTKLQNTYVDVLPQLIDKKTGRIHTSFNQAVTTTGRLSSSDPNLQNIPIRTELGKKIRDAFVAESGNVLIVADYSQIELRIVASLAKDKHLIDIFQKGEDVHKATAAIIHGVPLDKVTKEMRHSAKEINFGVLYGMGAHGLSWRAGIPRWQAQEFIDQYFHQFSGVKAYVNQTLKFAKKEGYVETLFGRRRYIPELASSNFQLRSAGERMAVNMPVQGTAADVIKLAMIALDEEIQKKYSNNDVKLILQVHDELVLEVKKGLEHAVSALVKKTMEEVVKLRVPVEVHVSIGKRWGELK
ncbi:MAG: DNA polymerase I [Candidatus Magasanikbacteria bacterium RIFCSPLOWO2_12_FULL_47_9b]|nr:MAG: DNA polymerase I [Candidatus Magasanikbacteria bacterium RIFCSPLOWO2_02_FULL_47_16]OGH79716.1 MAG: DNA polymerase I [Candidatus Magasanikbacteria bacterium RIFCSPHIGHO2_02_FULL_48_18]OGH82042.1 MAG: DNA polymerase I [Candidatus Magasanikbacteria bacterium RIFCSPLOWO2_12_FULL_47_9b]